MRLNKAFFIWAVGFTMGGVLMYVQQACLSAGADVSRRILFIGCMFTACMFTLLPAAVYYFAQRLSQHKLWSPWSKDLFLSCTVLLLIYLQLALTSTPDLAPFPSDKVQYYFTTVIAPTICLSVPFITSLWIFPRWRIFKQ